MPKDALLHALLEYIHRRKLLAKGEKLVLAVSGGIDSMAMLDLFHKMRGQLGLELVVAHFNHQLRASESDDDEQFVRSRAKEYGLESYIESVDIEAIANASHRSIQETARDHRYKFLFELRASMGFTNIVTGHHADDNAETILFNFLRGSGVHGLTGIPLRRPDKKIIRPLLFATRDEIRQYVDEMKLPFREDSSNKKTEYTRNFIRKELIPVIRENINPNISGTIIRSAEIFQLLEEYLQGEVAKVLPGVIVEKCPRSMSLKLETILHLPLFLQEYVLKAAVEEFIAADIDFTTVKSLVSVVNAKTGSFTSLAEDLVFYHDRGSVIIKRLAPKADFSHRVQANKSYEFEFFKIGIVPAPKAEMNDNPCIEYIDGDALGSELRIRNWHPGDWFIPLGMKEKKKLSDYFIDEKVPLFEKDLIAILESDGNIVWICGHRLDNRYKITSKTKNILKLEYQPRTP